MPRFKVNWAPDKLVTLEEAAKRPGYYLNAINGDILRFDADPPSDPEDLAAIRRTFAGEDCKDTDPIFLLVTDDLDLGEGDVRGMLHDSFELKKADQGRFLTRTARHSAQVLDRWHNQD